MTFLQLLLFALLALLTSIWFYLRSRGNYWVKRGVTYDSSSILFARRRKHLGHLLQDTYRRYKNSGELFVGRHMVLTPAALLLDLDLIKSVFISDFESFPDRGLYHNERDDPLSANIVRAEGEAWRRLRTKFTPTFTSGKMKFMMPTVVAVGEHLAKVIGEQLELGNSELEIRDLCARYTTDVIGSVAFGIDCNSLRQPKTPFRVLGSKAFTSFNPILEELGTTFPRFFRWLGMKAFPQELIDFYSKILKENVEERERSQVKRNDFLDILIELKNTVEPDGQAYLNMNEMIGQAFMFFIAGFDTSSSTMSFCLYELSGNQGVQNKARAEIRRVLKQHDGVLSYECLKDMHYLEQVLLETLRKHPIAPTLRRITRKPYRVPNTPHTLDVGVQAIIPVLAIHYDEEFYPEPEKFDPDRFTPAAMKSRHPMTFLAFGAGPRVCMAERFGKLQTLVGLAMWLKDFRVSHCDQTQAKLTYDLKNWRAFSVLGGITLKVERVAED